MDVDSTVWDTAAWVRKAVLEVTGENLNPEVTSTWTNLLDRYGEAATTKVFDLVLSPRRVAEREPYANAAEILRALQEEHGIRVHFVTRNWDPDSMTPHLKPWLREHFGPRVGLTVTREDKLPIFDSLGAFGVIDDRPDTIERAANSGLWVAVRIQPWNQELLAKRDDLRGFHGWREVPDLLPSLLD